MPLDHKRINGPEDTVPYQLFTRLNRKSAKTRFDEIINSDGSRKCGRSNDEHRKIYLNTNVVSQAKGSAYIELGKTRVIVSVFDPREIPNKNDYSSKGEIYCEFKYASFSCHKRRLHQQDSEEKACSALMKQALESAVIRHEFPNFQVDIYALVLHNDGSALSAAINAAGVALNIAGIHMYDVITSVSLAIQGDHVLMDPTLDEEDLCRVPLFENNDHGIIVYSMLSTHEQVSQFYQSGSLSMSRINSCIESLINATKSIVPLVETRLVKHVMSSMKNKAED